MSFAEGCEIMSQLNKYIIKIEEENWAMRKLLEQYKAQEDDHK